jgi:hypothetical protein
MINRADSVKNGSYSFTKMRHSAIIHEYGTLSNESAIVENMSHTIYVADSGFMRADSYLWLSYS